MPPLTVRAIRATPVEVPLNFVLGTSKGAVRPAPLLLIDLETEEGVTGRSYLFCYLRAAAPAIVSLLGEVERVAKGERVDPAALWAKLARRFTLIGVQGIVRMAMSGFDVACWDALGIAAGQPLAALLGASPRPIPAYNSCGLGLMDDLGALAAEAETLLAGRLPRGQAAARLSDACARTSPPCARCAGASATTVALMVDYNQALVGRRGAGARPRARCRKHLLAGGADPPRRLCRRGRAGARAEDAGPDRREFFAAAGDGGRARTQGAADYVMPDLERIGGVTGWRQAADLAAVNHVKMSSHLFPEVSAHLLAATPTCHFLEYVDWANVLVQEPLAIVDGHAIVTQRPGNGMVWDADAVARFRFH